MNKQIVLFAFLIVISVYVMSADAQISAKQLVITEVKLNTSDNEVWFEIFNPENVTLFLNRLRISAIKSPNILSIPSTQINGYEIKPGERVIICSDKKSFDEKYKTNITKIEVKQLKNIGDGGFISINNTIGGECSKNIIRFGNKNYSHSVAEKVSDNEVISLLNKELSYSRQINKEGVITAWTKTISAPGKELKSKEVK
jgi:hypothetical protein